MLELHRFGLTKADPPTAGALHCWLGPRPRAMHRCRLWASCAWQRGRASCGTPRSAVVVLACARAERCGGEISRRERTRGARVATRGRTPAAGRRMEERAASSAWIGRRAPARLRLAGSRTLGNVIRLLLLRSPSVHASPRAALRFGGEIPASSRRGGYAT